MNEERLNAFEKMLSDIHVRKCPHTDKRSAMKAIVFFRSAQPELYYRQAESKKRKVL